MKLFCLLSVLPVAIRLSGGSSRCVGVLEAAEQEKWQPVLVQHRDLVAAAGVCGRLDCGSVVSARGIQIKRSRPLLNFFSEFNNYKLEITCSGECLS